ncbi:MAG: PTS sugar transporter subunit IIB [Brevinemataceae bacterium]
MTNILLCCSAGMSTSLFVQKTKDHAKEINEPIEITAVPVSELDSHIGQADIIVLAPQIRFQKDTVTGKTDKPVFIIEMRDYGTMNVQKVLPEILAAVKES